MLGASTAELDERYRGLDAGVREPLLADMRAEDGALARLVAGCRLGKWFEGALDLARRAVADEAAAEVRAAKGMRDVAAQLRAIEGEIEVRERERAREMLRSKPRQRARQRVGGGGSFGFGASFGSSIRP